ncbi:hypothetical protein ACLM45_00785 [Synechococcus sp. A10-1-5-9]|uniref:hypothetical protein n=1 Tax=Synechococcus sp. A10-1-5-9 TaxID=3392295 RepID=UPI0039E80E7A
MGQSQFLTFLLGTLLLGAAVPEQALATIKDEYQRAHSCDYFKAPFLSDVGLYKDQKVRFCISADQSELIYVMAMGTSWVVPFNREYRSDGVRRLYTLEKDDLVLYQKEDGVVKRMVLGRRR